MSMWTPYVWQRFVQDRRWRHQTGLKWSPFVAMRYHYIHVNNSLRADVKKWNSRSNIVLTFDSPHSEDVSP